MILKASGARPINWQAERDRIDLAQVATRILGPAPGRRGEGGRRLWWICPFHKDGNPSFCVDPGRPWWCCYGCGARGGAATLVMRCEGLSFPEAVVHLTGGPASSGRIRPRALPVPEPPPPARPKGMPEADALALVEGAEAGLWTAEGAEALAYLLGRRHLDREAIRAARLGVVVEPLDLPGRPRGIVVPWFDGGRLAMAKIRQPDGREPKYRETFRDRPGLYPGRGAIQPGLPLVVVEGEFDALLLGQELAGLASVATLGGASSRPDAAILGGLLAAAPWFIATDGDEAGDKAAAGWPAARSRRVRPPGPFKDWTEARQGGVNLRRWWVDRLGGNETPPLFTWDELAAWRWSLPAADDGHAIEPKIPIRLDPGETRNPATRGARHLTEIEVIAMVDA